MRDIWPVRWGSVIRPVAAVVLAHFSDTCGRKRMFPATILLMALPTLLIGMLPTSVSMGLLPCFYLSRAWCREWQSAERPFGKTGIAVGLLSSGLTFGILLGSLVTIGLNSSVCAPQILGGYWRLPFVFGGVLGFVAMLVLRWLSDTPVM